MLNVSYDQEADALYLKLTGGGPIARTIEVDEGTLVDVDELGAPVGIEVLNPARGWPLQVILERFQIEPADRRMLEVMFGGTPRAGTNATFGPAGIEGLGSVRTSLETCVA